MSLTEFTDFFSARNFEHSRRFSKNSYSPEPLAALLKQLGNPQNSYTVFHVAGTVAKGSLAALLARYFQNDQQTTGLYTSPHLLRLNERIKINEKEISNLDFIALFRFLRDNFDLNQLSYFDALTAIGFLYFQKQGVTTAVIEVGLGGRLDSTNVVNPAAVFLGPVGIDHRNVLGLTVTKIAYEKAGIMKPGAPAYSMEQLPQVAAVFTKVAKSVQAQLVFTDYLKDIDYRETNRNFIQASLTHFLKKQVILPAHEIQGKFELFSSEPLVIFDSAHNLPSMKMLKQLLDQSYPKEKIQLWFTCMRERSPSELLSPFMSDSRYKILFPAFDIPACYQPSELTSNLLGLGTIVDTQNIVMTLTGHINIFCGSMRLYEPLSQLL